MILKGRSLRSIEDVSDYQMCSGCGACAFVASDAIEMKNVTDRGRRPVTKRPLDPGEQNEALSVCPGKGLAHDPSVDSLDLIEELRDGWGPVLELWEGHATDPEIRWAGSSGGALTALSLYALEREGMAGVLNTRMRTDVPYLAETVLSRDRADLLGATGSLYTPTSPCERLDLIEEAEGPCVFVGKPCDAAATKLAEGIRERLERRCGLRIAMFCAGTPSTGATLEMIERMGFVDPDRVRSVRYRGNGWPGLATATAEEQDGGVRKASETYGESWGALQRRRQWRCYVCADHTGEFADIAVGDPWYRPIQAGEAGSSLILARTERGRRFVRGAIEAGYLSAEAVQADLLPRSQPNLLRTRGMIWARIWVTRLLGAAAPRYVGMPMFRFWLRELSLQQKAQSVYGTVARVFRKGLRRRRPADSEVPVSASRRP